MISLEDISPEEASAELARRQSKSSEPKSGFGQAVEGQKGWITGLARGLGQSIGDVGASIGNVPADAMESMGYERPYTIPHPSLRNTEPTGFGEMIGQQAGEALPRIGFEAALGNRLGTLGGRSGMARVGLGGLGGGLAGALAKEGERKQGALEGAGAGLVGGALTEYPLFQKQAARGYKQINKSVAKNDIGGFHLSPETHDETNKLLKFSDLAPERGAIKQFAKDSKEGSYQNIHDFQSHLRTLSGDLFKEGKHRMGKRVSDLRSKILSDMKTNFNEQGYPNLTNKYERSQDLYRRHHFIKPYASSLAKILGGGTALGAATGVGYKMGTSGGH